MIFSIVPLLFFYCETGYFSPLVTSSHTC